MASSGSPPRCTTSFPSALGELFRGKLLDALQRAHREGKLRFDGPAATFADRDSFRRLLDKLRRLRWVVYCKPPFGDDSLVFRYLGQYTHRVGISNHRLVALDERGVTFRTRGAATVTLSADEFLRRFVLHVLPKGFVKIRHHGLFAAGNVHSKLTSARALLARRTTGAAEPTPERATPPQPPRDFREVLLALTGLDLRHCLRCGGLALVRCPLDPPLEAVPAPCPTSDHPRLDTS